MVSEDVLVIGEVNVSEKRMRMRMIDWKINASPYKTSQWCRKVLEGVSVIGI